jgi:hypothetical protein
MFSLLWLTETPIRWNGFYIADMPQSVKRITLATEPSAMFACLAKTLEKAQKFNSIWKAFGPSRRHE